MGALSRFCKDLSVGAALAILAGCTGAASGSAGPTVSQAVRRDGAPLESLDRYAELTARGLPSSFDKRLPIGTSPVHGFVTPGLMTPGGATAFVSDYDNNVVYILNKAGTITATLAGFQNPYGMATDKGGDLYVVNQGASNVLEFAPPYTGAPIATFSDPGEIAIDVAVDNDGNVAVTNTETTAAGAGDVVFYSNGSKNPTGKAMGNTFTSPRFCAFDKNGDLVLDDVDIFNTKAVNVGAILRGNLTNPNGKIITLTTSNAIVYPGGVQVTPSGNVAVDDQSASPPSIYTYEAPTSRNLGSPISTTVLSGTDSPVTFAFSAEGTLVFTVDAALSTADLFHYPAGGSPIEEAGFPPFATPLGVAVVPTEQFTIR